MYDSVNQGYYLGAVVLNIYEETENLDFFLYNWMPLESVDGMAECIAISIIACDCDHSLVTWIYLA